MKGSVMIEQEMTRLKELLLLKNNAYGDSALQKGILFDVEPEQAIMCRINDKLSRIKNVGITDDTEDTIDDLIGYLVLLNIARKKCETCKRKLTEDSPYCSANIHLYNEQQ